MNALHGLSVWNRACGLAIRTCETVGDCRDRVFQEALTRVCLALPASIAAGYEYDSKRQFAQYLRKSRGYCAELRTQLYIAAQLDLIPLTRSTELMQETVEITRMLNALVNWCEARAEGRGQHPRAVPRQRPDL